MDRLPADLCARVFSFLDHQSLATAIQVCRRWKDLGIDDHLWRNLFAARWGGDAAEFFAPLDDGAEARTKSWKDVYEVQDRCDRVGVGLKIIREGRDYYLVHQGEIQRFLGSSTEIRESRAAAGEEGPEQGERQQNGVGLSEKILFFIGDLEVACADAKRTRLHE